MRNTSFAHKPATMAAAVTLLIGMSTYAALAQTPAPAPAPAPAAPATPPPNYKVQYNGLIDGYLQYQFNNPKSGGLTDSDILPGDEEYDVRDNTPTLAEAELNVFANAKPSSVGFHTTLQAGDTPAINTYSREETSREGRYENIAQLYGTYAIGGNGAGVDFGKFYTPFGYEVVDANQNFNYTRSLPFYFLPVYHTGFRAYTPTIKGFTLTGIVANSLYNTPVAGVSNDTKGDDFAYIGSLNYTMGKYTFITTDGYDEDYFNPDPTAPTDKKSKIFLTDNDFTYSATSMVTLGANLQYGDFSQSNYDTDETGYAVYAKDQFTPRQAFAARFSEEDLTFSGYSKKQSGYSNASPYEFTVTYEYKPSGNFTTRLEYRHDSVNNNDGEEIAFTDGNDNPTNSQDLIILAGMFTF